MPSTLDDVEKRVRDRLKELEPLVREAAQLREVLANFEGTRAQAQRGPAAGRGTGRTSRPRGRPVGSATGGRAREALGLVAERPGITVAELAEAMVTGPTYLYRVMPSLEREGKVQKIGTGYHPVEVSVTKAAAAKKTSTAKKSGAATKR
jgi:hypothetical protein